MDDRDTNHRLPPLGLVALFLVFGSVIAMIPFTVTAELIRVRRVRRRARSYKCPKCSEIIGREALKIQPGLRDQILNDLVLDRDFDRWPQHLLDAVCPRCARPSLSRRKRRISASFNFANRMPQFPRIDRARECFCFFVFNPRRRAIIHTSQPPPQSPLHH